jgi:hypothetical protein
VSEPSRGRTRARPHAITQRTFNSTDHVSAFVRIYEGGAAPLQPIALRTHITDGHDAIVSDVSEAIGLDRFDGSRRSADARLDVPLARLAPGQYLFTIEATMGRLTDERDEPIDGARARQSSSRCGEHATSE